MKAYMQYKYIKDKRLAKRAGSGRDRGDFPLCKSGKKGD